MSSDRNDPMSREPRKTHTSRVTSYDIGAEYLATPAQPPPDWMEDRSLLPKKPPGKGHRS